MFHAIGRLVGWWAHVYSDTKALSAAVLYLHLAGILVAGGVALATDRASLLLRPEAEPDVARELRRLGAVHRIVLAGLAVTVASGVLMFLSDARTYATSALFWTKMALILVLLGNGWLRLRAERVLADGLDAWRRFRATSVASVALWLGVLLAGVFLTTIS
jgi:hypothetical protein